MKDKIYTIPVKSTIEGFVRVNADCLETAIEKAKKDFLEENPKLDYHWDEKNSDRGNLDFDTLNQTKTGRFLELEEMQDNFYQVFSIRTNCSNELREEGASNFLYNLNSDEFDLIDEILTQTQINQYLWIDQFYKNGKRVDIFYDQEDCKYITLIEGIEILKDAVMHINNEQYNKLDNIVKKINSLKAK